MPITDFVDTSPPSQRQRSHQTRRNGAIQEGGPRRRDTLRERIRTIIRQVCKELGVQIVSGVLSREHVHMFVEIPPHIAVSDFVRRVKGRSSHRVQMEFPDLRKRNWGRHFWARGYFCTTSGNITDEAILQYLKYRRQPVVIQCQTRTSLRG